MEGGRELDMSLWTAWQFVTSSGGFLMLKLPAGFSQQLCKYLLVNPCLRMLGFSFGDSTIGSQFGDFPAVGRGFDDVACTGTETDIRQCTHTNPGNCGVTEGAGVRCSNAPPTPAVGRII